MKANFKSQILFCILLCLAPTFLGCNTKGSTDGKPFIMVMLSRTFIPSESTATVSSVAINANEFFEFEHLYLPTAAKFGAIFEEKTSEEVAALLKKKLAFKKVDEESELYRVSLDIAPPTLGQVLLDDIMRNGKQALTILTTNKSLGARSKESGGIAENPIINLALAPYKFDIISPAESPLVTPEEKEQYKELRAKHPSLPNISFKKQ